MENHLTKPESRCVRHMAVGILKSGSVLVNRIASNIHYTISLSQTTKRFHNHYTKVDLQGTEMAVNQISKKVPLFMHLDAVKMGKNKKRKVSFKCGATKIKYKAGKQEHELWLVITKRENGGYCWLLTRSPKENIIDVIEEAFTAYGFRWKIEEYHRHIKPCYSLEDIQIKTFEGLQTMLAILTIAMGIIYSSLSSMHI